MKTSLRPLVYVLLVSKYLLWCTNTIYAKEPLLILREQGANFTEVVKGITDELSNEFRIHEKTIHEKLTVDSLASCVESVSPRLVVLLNNRAITLFKKYQKEKVDTASYIPSLALMGAYVRCMVTGLKNAGAISYEIPITTSVVHLRSLVTTPIQKVGVIYREFMKEDIQQNIQYCKKEKIEIVGKVVPRNEKHIRNAVRLHLKTLLKEEQVDALWILNDNVLLKPDIIRDVWVPLVNRYKKPTIVGVDVLVQPSINLGTFAILPDHVALGVQAADIISDAAENDWMMEKVIVPPLSVYKIINLKQLKRFCPVKEHALNNIDKIVQ